MSVAAFISNPINCWETDLYVPLATEAFFNKVWLPGSQALYLEWIPYFSNGIDVTKADLPQIQEELAKLEIWAENSLPRNDYEQLRQRINFIARELPKLFTREDIIVFIG